VSGDGRDRGRDGNGERFADALGDDVVPLSDRDRRRAPTSPPPDRRAAAPPDPPPVRFVADGEGRGRAEGVRTRTLARLRRGEPPPEREIDLHGLDARAAQQRVRGAIETARAEGVRCLLVIHGRGRRSPGEAVLRRGLPAWLTRPPLDRAVLAYTRAPERLGGDGASLVLLRR